MKFTKFIKKTEEFIETGTNIGNGVDLALSSGFSKIHSIELSESYYDKCVERFKNNPNINLILGDSFYKLKELLDSNPDTCFTYWLDGHYSGDDTACGVEESPLLKELEVILSRDKTGEVIYVDDMRIYREFDERLNIRTIKDLILKYKPNAEFYYEASNWDEKDILVLIY